MAKEKPPRTGSGSLSAETIAALDGGMFGKLIDSAIKQLSDDIDDRGHDGQVRKLTITIEIKRDMKSRNERNVTIAPKVKAETPAFQPSPTVAKSATREGESVLLFQMDNPDNPDQEARIYAEGEVAND
jgi:hypothetical protein